jgi:ribonuclease T1
VKDKRAILSLVAAVVVALVVWAGSGGATQESPADPAAGASGQAAGDYDVVAAADLPVEARDTLALIDSGGPFPYEQDGATFGNFERLLPEQPRGYYTEYTVDTPGSDDRGARRIVAGEGGDFYYTGDHYASFRRISR